MKKLALFLLLLFITGIITSCGSSHCSAYGGEAKHYQKRYR